MCPKFQHSEKNFPLIRKQKWNQYRSKTATVKYGTGSNMLKVCFPASGMGALQREWVNKDQHNFNNFVKK